MRRLCTKDESLVSTAPYSVVRDFVGYGPTPPNPQWPGGARLAVNFVMNIEEGSEYAIEHGENRSDVGLTESSQPRVPSGRRDLAAESMFEYGSRVGFWRLHRLFRERSIPVTPFACALALERNPAIAEAIVAAGWDVCCHGLRWIEHWRLSEDHEREHIARAAEIIRRLTGSHPAGWYCRYGPSENTRRLLVEHGGFAYDSDAYNDEFPYWVRVGDRPHLVVPYSLTTNDTKMMSGGGLADGDSFFTFLRQSFDLMREEGAVSSRLMNVGMHLRILGHPGRAAGLAKFLDYVQGFEDVWLCRRIDVARHWAERFPAI
jgi:allantoinase